MALQNNLTQLPGQCVPASLSATQNFTQNLNTELPQNNTVPECKALKISKPIWKAITDRIPELLAPYAKICQVSSSQTFRFLWLGHLQGTGHVELRFELVDLTTQMVVLHFELLHFIQSLGSRMCSVPRYASLLFCKG